MPIIKDEKTGNMVQVESNIHYEAGEYGDVMVVEGTRTPEGGHRKYKPVRKREEIVKRNSENGQLLADRKNLGNERFNPEAYHWKQSQRYERGEFKEKTEIESPLEVIVNIDAGSQKIVIPFEIESKYQPKKEKYEGIEHQVA